MESQHVRPDSPRRFSWPLAFTLSALILALLVAFIFYRCETLPGRSLRQMEEVGRDARDAFVRVAQLQPRVTINDRVYFEQTTKIAQLAVLDRRIEVEHEMLHTWAGSTKRIKLHGTFAVKAGFDLHQRFSVRVLPNEVIVELPHAQILSVEEEKVDVLAFENGYWNRISPNDIEHEFAILPQLARERAAGLPAEAERVFTQQLLEKFHPQKPVRAIFPAPSPAG